MGLVVDSYRFAAAGGGFTPADLPSLFGWWDFSDTATITGSPTATAVSSSGGSGGYGLSGSATTGTSTLNGLNVLNFVKASSHFMAIGGSGTILAQPLTIAMVVKVDVKASKESIASSLGGDFLKITGESNWQIRSGGTDLTDGASDTSWHVLTAIFNGVSSSIRVDGTTVVSGNAGTQGIAGTNWALNRWNDFGSKYSSNSLGELVMDGAATGGSDLSDLETYLATKWGL